MNKKTTKRALLTSVLSLVLCMSMLIGTTFAWFTDSVTSRNNIIKSGNLDVKLEYSTDGETWTEVTDDTSLFSEKSLWEPGHTEAVAFRVSNVGTLALKYDFNTSVYFEKEGTNVYDDTFKLSDYLEVGHSAVQQDGEVGDIFMGLITSSRENAISFCSSKIELGESIANPNPAILPGEAHVFAIAITMPTTVGNEANYKTGTEAPYIQFGVNLYATQYTYENDSFGSDYDADAEYQIAPVANVSALDVDTISATAGMGGAVINGGIELDAAFRFQTTETYEEAQASDYRYWHADFVVTADKAVADNSIALAGYYAAYCEDYNDGNWVALINDGMPVEAGQEIRLLQLMLNGGSMSYQELCNWVPTFDCGLADLDGSNAGNTITVELRLYEVTENAASTDVETGHYVTVGTYSYTL